MTTYSHGINPLGDLDSVDCWEPGSWCLAGHQKSLILPGLWVRDKHLKAELGDAGLQGVGGEAVAAPAVLQPLLGHHGEALPQAVHGVDGPGVMVDPAPALPAVPVLAQSVKVQVK